MNSWREKKCPQLYIATMDIRKCYDSVNIDRMIQMIKEEKFFQEIYLIHNFTKVIRSKRYIFSKPPPNQRYKDFDLRFSDSRRMAVEKNKRYNERGQFFFSLISIQKLFSDYFLFI